MLIAIGGITVAIVVNLLNFLMVIADGIDPPWDQIAFSMIGWIARAASIPLVVWLARGVRARSERVAMPLSLLLAIPYTVVLQSLLGIVFYLLGFQVPGREGFAETFTAIFFSGGLPMNALVFIGVVLTVRAVDARQRLHGGELIASALRTRLVESQVRQLQMQLQPHFIFNALNAILAMVESDRSAALRMTEKLRQLLNASLVGESKQEVELRAELELLRNYIEIQQVRFGERVRFRLEVPDDLRKVLVPTLILQPLVENALRHGVSAQEGGTVSVRAEREGDELVLSVRDDGEGIELRRMRVGIGIGNTRARLNYLYGEKQSLQIASRPGEGFFVRVAMPCRIAEGEM
jgi:two-component system, LytTR family, sensor kinase